MIRSGENRNRLGKPSRRGWLLAGMVLLAVCGIGLVVLVISRKADDFLARQFSTELEHLPDDQLPDKMQQLIRLGEPGLRATVQQLSHSRAAIVHAARDVLFEELQAWRQLRAKQSSQRIELLARELAQRMTSFGPQARQYAAELATEILLWPIDHQRVDTSELLVHCERILRATPDQNPARPPDVVPPETGDQPQSDQRTDHLVGFRREGDVVDDQGPGSPPAMDDRPFTHQPRRFIPEDPPAANNNDAPPPPPTVTDSSDARRKLQAMQYPTELLPVPPTAPNRLDQRIQYSSMTHIEVMQRMHHPDPAISQAARQELRRRQFNDQQIQAGLRITNPDPAQRAQAARDVIHFAGIKPEPWLKWLARDEHPLVRAAALSILATSTNEENRQYVKDRLATETDEAVLQRVKLR